MWYIRLRDIGIHDKYFTCVEAGRNAPTDKYAYTMTSSQWLAATHSYCRVSHDHGSYRNNSNTHLHREYQVMTSTVLREEVESERASCIPACGTNMQQSTLQHIEIHLLTNILPAYFMYSCTPYCTCIVDVIQTTLEHKIGLHAKESTFSPISPLQFHNKADSGFNILSITHKSCLFVFKFAESPRHQSLRYGGYVPGLASNIDNTGVDTRRSLLVLPGLICKRRHTCNITKKNPAADMDHSKQHTPQ